MSLVVVEAPSRNDRGLSPFHKSVFLAGGITGCPDWQHDAITLFDKMGGDLILYNPRQADFPIHDPDAALAQITWEHEALRFADAVLFWFCAETVQPIVLYELGAWTLCDKPIFVGVHPNYERKQDVVIQTGLARPEVEIVSDLISLVENVMEWASH